MNIIEYKIPEWALNYIINGDGSGLSDFETCQVDEFMASEGIQSVSIKNEEPYFTWENDIDGQVGGNVYDCECIVRE